MRLLNSPRGPSFALLIFGTLFGRGVAAESPAAAELPFASPLNVRAKGIAWTDSYSHGELLRSGYDQRMEIDPTRLEFLFQGVTDKDRAGKVYGQIPWQLGLLRPAP